jgi:hypothetical protein
MTTNCYPLLAHHRGEVQILDRDGLQAVACECYSAEGTIYADILG